MRRWTRPLFLVAALACGASGCRKLPDTAFTDLLEARRLAADLRVQFTKAGDASNRAVMADTDAASVEYAGEAQRLKGSVTADVAALELRVRRLEQAAAVNALDAFSRHFAAYDKLDREVLQLAGENTNLKAQRLSFGPARDAAEAFRSSLEAVAASASAKDRCRAQEHVAAAVTALLQIEVLFAPHIAEREDTVMTRLESDMAALQTKAEQAVAALSGPFDAKSKAALENAKAALDRFAGFSKEIVKLSRRNTNVVSLDLALRRMPTLAGACDESLRQLQEALAKDPFPATR